MSARDNRCSWLLSRHYSKNFTDKTKLKAELHVSITQFVHLTKHMTNSNKQ